VTDTTKNQQPVPTIIAFATCATTTATMHQQLATCQQQESTTDGNNHLCKAKQSNVHLSKRRLTASMPATML